MNRVMVTDIHIVARKVSSVNPATGEVLRELECASESDVLAAVARAQAAQTAWGDLGARKRIAILIGAVIVVLAIIAILGATLG